MKRRAGKKPVEERFTSDELLEIAERLALEDFRDVDSDGAQKTKGKMIRALLLLASGRLLCERHAKRVAKLGRGGRSCASQLQAMLDTQLTIPQDRVRS